MISINPGQNPFIRQTTTNTLTLGNHSGGAGPLISAPFEVNQRFHDVKCDGKIEDFVLQRTHGVPVYDIQQLKTFFEDKRGAIAEAKINLQDAGSSSVPVDLKEETGHVWNMSKTENGNFKFINLFVDSFVGDETILIKNDNSMAELQVKSNSNYETRTDQVQQEILAMNSNGTISCLQETVTTVRKRSDSL